MGAFPATDLLQLAGFPVLAGIKGITRSAWRFLLTTARGLKDNKNEIDIPAHLIFVRKNPYPSSCVCNDWYSTSSEVLGVESQFTIEAFSVDGLRDDIEF